MITLSFKKKSSSRQELLISKLGMRESIGETFFKGGGVSLNIIIMSGWVEINFCLMRGGYDLV